MAKNQIYSLPPTNLSNSTVNSKAQQILRTDVKFESSIDGLMKNKEYLSEEFVRNYYQAKGVQH